MLKRLTQRATELQILLHTIKKFQDSKVAQRLRSMARDCFTVQ